MRQEGSKMASAGSGSSPSGEDLLKSEISKSASWRDHWKVVARSEIACIKAEQERLIALARVDGAPSREMGAFSTQIAENLTMACRMMQNRGLRDVWFGGASDATYKHIHVAASLLAHISPVAELKSQAPYLAGKAQELLPGSPAKLEHIHSLISEDPPDDYRSAFARAREEVYDIADHRYSQLRRFRNNLLVAGFLISGIVAILIVIGWRSPGAIALCFQSDSGVEVVDSCPTSERVEPRRPTDVSGTVQSPTSGAGAPSRDDVLVVAVLGLVGGALSGALAVRRVGPTRTPYDVPLWNFLIKLPVGALTAIAGLVVVAGQIIPGLSALDSQAQILAYALFFGLAQQVLTRYVDNRAEQVLTAIPTKSDGPGQPAEAHAENGASPAS
jgi:hypothetical protein